MWNLGQQQKKLQKKLHWEKIKWNHTKFHLKPEKEIIDNGEK